MITRLLVVAQRWQRHNNRSAHDSVTKILEEICEYQTARLDASRAEELDELGDIIVNALRAFLALGEHERKFLVRVMEAKTQQRVTEGKNKFIEEEQRKRLAEELLKES